MLVLDSFVIRHSPFVIASHWLNCLAPLSPVGEGPGVRAEVNEDVEMIQKKPDHYLMVFEFLAGH